MFQIDLKWHDFPVNLPAVEAWVKANAGAGYTGNSADHDLTLWFSAQPSDAQVSDIQAYWSSLSNASSEATSYKSAAQMASDAASAKAAAIASATSKLEALGLTADEIKAVLGQ